MKIERVVVDTSMVIAAIHNRGGEPAQVLKQAMRDYTLVFSNESFEELRTRLMRPKFDRAMAAAARAALIESLYELGELVVITGAKMGCRDETDDKILETAVAGKANCLICNDKDMPSLRPIGEDGRAMAWSDTLWRGVAIVYPGEFLRLSQ